MKNDYLNMLASLVLPAQILDYFLISGVEQTSQEIHISLDEKMNPKLSNDVHFESKGFMEAVNVTDFPIRDHKVILKIRRRRWTDLRTGKQFTDFIKYSCKIPADFFRFQYPDIRQRFLVLLVELL